MRSSDRPQAAAFLNHITNFLLDPSAHIEDRIAHRVQTIGSGRARGRTERMKQGREPSFSQMAGTTAAILGA